MTWTVTLVPPEAIREWWPTVGPMLEPAVNLSKGRADMISVLQWLLERKYLLWIAYDEDHVTKAAFVTREARYPCRSMLAIDFAGGSEHLGWAAEGTRIFRSFARDVGLDGVELAGRIGWQKSLRPYGWSATGMLIETNAAEYVA